MEVTLYSNQMHLQFETSALIIHLKAVPPSSLRVKKKT